MVRLNNYYTPTNQTRINEKDDTLKSAKKLLDIREEVINAFNKGIFLYVDRFQADTDEETDEYRYADMPELETTDMPELENEESAASRKKQRRRT